MLSALRCSHILVDGWSMPLLLKELLVLYATRGDASVLPRVPSYRAFLSWHRARQREWPFFVIGAGLPSLPAVLADSRSYAERQFSYRTIGPLSPTDAADALRVTVEAHGGAFTPEALEIVVEASGGYPYFLQEFGKVIWHTAPTSPGADLHRLFSAAASLLPTITIPHCYVATRATTPPLRQGPAPL